MNLKYEPISKKFPHFLHGGDYNPEQWLKTPEVIDKDIELMKEARCNVVSLGMFSWVNLEPQEGVFEFGWLDEIMDKLSANNIYVFLATPSGARPAWLAQKYPEVLRVEANRVRNLFGERHNHCYTSPIYREKVTIINTRLAHRYKDHPALIGWHVSNEYGGECHCELCQDAFRKWLREKYDDDLDKLNFAWWTNFWSRRYTDWSQIESPSPRGQATLNGLNLDWKRFVTDQTLDFYKNEIKPLKEIAPYIPVTTNFMGTYEGLNYWKFAPYLDVISWDSYPRWHGEKPDWKLASEVGFVHDINRSLKNGKPFLLMESTPSMTNWMEVAKLKRPGMHLLSSLQAVAHGSDSVQYFQWRKSRGGTEKFHGAVVDHCGHENTRVFRDVKEVGETLEKLDDILGTSINPEVAIIYDWENKWAIDGAYGPRREKKDYLPTCQAHYLPFWRKGVSVDIIDMNQDFSKYKLLIAPMLHMVRSGVDKKIEEFVENGGTFVTTYWSGIVDENDLCFLGGFPGPLRSILGIWSEEIDALYDEDYNLVKFLPNEEIYLEKEYRAEIFCDLIHSETAKVLAKYQRDFYVGFPAVTVNNYGKGKAYYIAFRDDGEFLKDFYGDLINKLQLKRALEVELPEGVTTQWRTDGNRNFVFVMNFTPEIKNLNLGDIKLLDLLTDEKIENNLEIAPYGIKIVENLSI